MKYNNIKIFDYFLENSYCHFKLKYLLISLKRSYVFNLLDDETIYYRKNISYRKMSSFGLEKKIILPRKIKFSQDKCSNYQIKDISNIISEYLTITNVDNVNDFNFDIAKRHNSRKIVTMDFNENENSKFDFNNIFWIDAKNKMYNMSQFDI